MLHSLSGLTLPSVTEHAWNWVSPVLERWNNDMPLLAGGCVIIGLLTLCLVVTGVKYRGGR